MIFIVLNEIKNWEKQCSSQIIKQNKHIRMCSLLRGSCLHIDTYLPGRQLLRIRNFLLLFPFF